MPYISHFHNKLNFGDSLCSFFTILQCEVRNISCRNALRETLGRQCTYRWVEVNRTLPGIHSTESIWCACAEVGRRPKLVVYWFGYQVSLIYSRVWISASDPCFFFFFRIATDLNLHQAPSTQSLTERQEREVLNRTRVWMICFTLDRSTATQFGKQSTIKEDYIIRNSADWYKKSQYKDKVNDDPPQSPTTLCCRCAVRPPPLCIHSVVAHRRPVSQEHLFRP